MTPLYLIAFLDDCSDALKVHCLARKDQSYNAWHITKASWEMKMGKIRVDGGGELGSGKFVKSLEEDGIQRDVVPHYEH
jgi:hypothetical protein